jgi:hypothetical protein
LLACNGVLYSKSVVRDLFGLDRLFSLLVVVDYLTGVHGRRDVMLGLLLLALVFVSLLVASRYLYGVLLL